MNTTNLFLENYYDFHNTCYYQILTLNNIPNGPLKSYIKLISIKNVTKINNANTNYCSYVINKNILNNNSNSSSNITNFINNKFNYCTIEDITQVYDFLINNNYTINNELTNIIKSFSSANSSLENQFTIINNKKLLLCFNYN
tara:strand:+ start:8998 stop:9426 length:429 start_codon:yes stop_codon:yes gene_type:complete